LVTGMSLSVTFRLLHITGPWYGTRHWVVSLSLHRRGFVPVSDHLWYVVDKVRVGLVSVFPVFACQHYPTNATYSCFIN
jgi:hypothetical protein